LEKFVKGDVVVVPFPFSDLTEAKRRPALVLAELDGDYSSELISFASFYEGALKHCRAKPESVSFEVPQSKKANRLSSDLHRLHNGSQCSYGG